MDSGTKEAIWIGALVSLVITIGGNLLTPAIKARIDDWGKTSQQKKTEKLRAEYRRVLFYALHTDMLLGELLMTTLIFLFFLVLVALGAEADTSLGATLPFVLPDHLMSQFRPYATAISIALSAVEVTIVAGIIWSAYKVTKRTLSLFLHVRYFDDYVKGIPQELRQEGIEAIVVGATWERALPGMNQIEEEWKRYSSAKGNGTSTSTGSEPAPQAETVD